MIYVAANKDNADLLKENGYKIENRLGYFSNWLVIKEDDKTACFLEFNNPENAKYVGDLLEYFNYKKRMSLNGIINQDPRIKISDLSEFDLRNYIVKDRILYLIHAEAKLSGSLIEAAASHVKVVEHRSLYQL